MAEAACPGHAGHRPADRTEHSLTSSFRYVAPAGSPISIGDLARWAQACTSSADLPQELARTIRTRFGVKHCVFASTGRAGMTVILRAMRSLAPPDRDEVVLPSYTCYSVAASVVKAGLKVRLVDIVPATLDFDSTVLENTDMTRVLAIVATNLYGLPNDLQAVTAIARRHNVFVIDDAAQAMGATVGGRLSGTRGDAGLFSFDKGKNVSAIDGGVMLTNSDDLARAVTTAMAESAPASFGEAAVGAVKALAYAVLLRPSLYWIPRQIPQLELGKTRFTTEFAIEKPPRALIALANTMLPHLDRLTATRVANAKALMSGLKDVNGVDLIAPGPTAVPVYLRLPLLVRNEGTRREVLHQLDAAGIGATGSYPASLGDVPALQPHLVGAGSISGGRQVAERIVTLPTHAFVGAADISRATRLVASIAGAAPDLSLAAARH